MKVNLKFSSVTYAIRAHKLLEQRGLRSYMKKSTDNTTSGCGYVLEIGESDLDTAKKLLAASDIRIVDVF